jgi:DNA-damage-inducible protein J
MSEQQTIQIRIDKKTKEASRKILSELGLDMSTAVKLFLTNVVNRQGIPFEIRTKNGFTEAEELAMIRETEEAKRSGKRFNSVEELMADLKL